MDECGYIFYSLDWVVVVLHALQPSSHWVVLVPRAFYPYGYSPSFPHQKKEDSTQSFKFSPSKRKMTIFG